jgi:flagellar biosynthetic protein FlhB
VGVIVLAILAPWIFRNCADMMRYFFTRSTAFVFGDKGNAEGVFYYIVKLVLPICLSGLVTAIAANLIQNRGFIFSLKPLEPNFGKIVPKIGQYFRKTVFSLQGAWNVVKSLVKVAILGLISFTLIRTDLEKLLSLTTVSPWTGIAHIAWMAAKLLVIAAVFFLVIAIPDYLMQRFQFMEQMKMSEQEMKEEYKSEEGDPQIKGRIMQEMQALLRQNIPKNVAESDVVIANPTHFAVALKYDRRVMDGPMVMAKGADRLAQRIKEIARDKDIPIVENRPLARELFSIAEVGAVIPQKYYSAVAIILANIQRAAG